MFPAPPGVTRFGFLNVSGLPTEPRSPQYQDLFKFIPSKGFSFLGVQEVNLNLSKCTASGSWSRRTAKYSGFSHASVNIHSSSEDQVLYGGTACFVEPKLQIRLGVHGSDPSGLGRWSWITLLGRQGIRTRVITGYRPVIDKSDKPNSVYSQQELYWKEAKVPYRCPRSAFLDDLGQAIKGWMAAGDQILLGLDANENTRRPLLQEWSADLGLIDVHKAMWEDATHVATCNKSTVSNHPIDAVWCSPGLDVAACGLSGFGSLDFGINTDHRLLWVDIADDSLFGFSAPSPAKCQITHFPLHDPRARKRYYRTLNRLRDQHGIQCQLADLALKSENRSFSKEDEGTYNRIAALDLELRCQAKSKCAPFYAGRVLYSAEIGALRKEIRLWKLMYQHRSKRRVDNRKIRRLMKRLDIKDAFLLNRHEIIGRREDVRKRYQHAKRHQVKLHKEHRARLHRSRAKATGTSPESQERADIHTAAMRKHFWHVRKVMDRKPRTNISILETIDEDGQTVQHTTREDIEAACAEEGARRFSQTTDTPFMTGSLHQQLGFQACQSVVDAILAGEFVPGEDVDEPTRLFLEELTMPDAIRATAPITGFVNAAEHAAGWKRMKGRIASSPFGPSFADFIAGGDHKETAAIDAAFANIPVAAGFYPDLWKKSLDVMIPKKVSSVNVRKLRIIVLFHSLFNMLNKRIGRSMIRQADTLGLIPLEAYGSRPGRRANICALNKVLAIDILHQLRRAGIICGNDASSCYDRIVHVVASICMQRLGVTPEVCKVMFGTLRELRHYVSTVFGQSSTAYGALRIPLQGIGQGNGAGPAIWLVMTIPLINMLRNRGYGIEAFAPFSGERIFFSCFTFVDDSDSIIAPLNCPTIQSLIQEAQGAIDLWGGGLCATGGALSLDKTYWWLIDTYWHRPSQQWRSCPTHSRPGTLWLRTPGSPPEQIRRLELSQAEETLGIWIAPDGNQTAQIAAMTSKIDAWAAKIATRQLTRTESWLSLTTGIHRTLLYPLVATRLSFKECTRVTKSLKTCALPALGLPKTMPLTVVHSPRRYLGYGVLDLWFEQGFEQVESYVHHANLACDITGSQLRCSLENLRLELGLPSCPLSYDYSIWHLCGTTVQVYIVWEFCSRLGLSIHDHLPALTVQRDGDVFLMESFAKNGFSPKQLAMLNRCRMFLRVIYLSDLATGDGTSLPVSVFHQRTPLDIHSDVSWPPQVAPNAHSWRLWNDALLRCFLCPHSESRGRLLRPLGAWFKVPVGWSEFLDPATSCYYVHRGEMAYDRYTLAQTGHAVRSLRVQFRDVVPCLPPGCLPTTGVGTGRIRQVSAPGMLLPPRPPYPPSNWWGVVIRWPTSLRHLLDGILAGTGACLTDGSLKNSWGTAGFTIRADILDKSDDLILANQTPGDPEDMDPYRAELGGAYGILRSVNQLLASCPTVPASGTSIILACDCESVLKNLFAKHDPRPSIPHYDLLTAARFELERSPLRWIPRHVRGHRDRVLPYYLLDPWEQLNCDMDRLAKTFWRTLERGGFRPHYLSEPDLQHWSLWLGPKRLCTWSRGFVEDLFYGAPVKQYWSTRLHYDTNGCNWDALSHAFKRLPLPRQLWVPRWLSSFLPLRSTLFRWGLATDDKCPRCPHTETRHHILVCSHPINRELVDRAIADLEVWLTSQRTHPSLSSGIVSMIRSWSTSTPWTIPAEVPSTHHYLLSSQAALGLSALMDGFMLRSWTAFQHAHYQFLGSKRTGKRWHSLLIRRIWQIAWISWQHRYQVLRSEDSLVLLRRHADLDAAIAAAFATDRSHLPRPARRWFLRSPSALHSETLDYKLLWLRNVQAWMPNHCEGP